MGNYLSEKNTGNLETCVYTFNKNVMSTQLIHTLHSIWEYNGKREGHASGAPDNSPGREMDGHPEHSRGRCDRAGVPEARVSKLRVLKESSWYRPLEAKGTGHTLGSRKIFNIY